ncbi:MAG: sigma-70 family RNA polymerase sigma factor [Bacteroides sp.]|nr:sigma-70 family RNA polymerase sigma factor [Bacteroides sp.]
MNDVEFETIARALRPRLMALCRRFFSAVGGETEAEDIVQETMLRLWRMREQLGQYDPEALAVKIAKNLCVDHYRRSRDMMATIDGTMNLPAAETADREVIAADTERWIEQAMRRLPAMQRRVLRMRSEGMDLDEIAAACGIARNSVKTFISAARRKLLEQINGRDLL